MKNLIVEAIQGINKAWQMFNLMVINHYHSYQITGAPEEQEKTFSNFLFFVIEYVTLHPHT